LSDKPQQQTIKTVLEDNRNISIPLDWMNSLGFSIFGHAQLTLIDDKIVIHKPLGELAGCKSPRKVGDKSYIRKIDLVGVLLPPQLLRPLSINSGSKIVLTLEKNSVTIRKDTKVKPQTIEPGANLEPSMAFCCVCGELLYTENGLKKVLSQYICHACIELVTKL